MVTTGFERHRLVLCLVIYAHDTDHEAVMLIYNVVCGMFVCHDKN